MIHHWDEFLIEGDELYNLMTNNFDSFIDGNTIKHFCIIDGIYRHIKNTDKMTNDMSDDIEKELLPWIKNELEGGRLFDKTLWKPFLNKYAITQMYYGYRKLFNYKKYIFQLAIEKYCELDECKYRNIHNNTTIVCCENSQHFCLALYGWKEEGSNMLQPYKQVIIPENNIIPEIHWIYK